MVLCRGGRQRGAMVMASVVAAPWLPATVTATPNASDGSNCGQVNVWGRAEIVSADPLATCSEAMDIAHTMIATWPADVRFVRFNGRECSGTSAGGSRYGRLLGLQAQDQ